MSRLGILWAMVAVAVVAEWALVHPYPGTPWWRAVPGVQAVYGIFGCVAIVLVSKWLGHLGLQRPEPEATSAGGGDGAVDDGIGPPGDRGAVPERRD
jgi:hypothetical protein